MHLGALGTRMAGMRQTASQRIGGRSNERACIDDMAAPVHYLASIPEESATFVTPEHAFREIEASRHKRVSVAPSLQGIGHIRLRLRRGTCGPRRFGPALPAA